MSWALTTDQITRLQIELTNYCNAGCPHCARVNYLNSDWVKGYKQQSPYPVSINSTHLDIDRYKQMIVNDQWQSLRDVHYCGNYDEPTVHPKMFEFIDCTVKHLPQVKSISIATNGGTRDSAWWQQLGEKSNQLKQQDVDLRVVWGIDGLEDTNHIYRKGVDWNKLKQNYTAYNQAGGNSTWQFIVFEHNEHQVEEARQMSQHLGFKMFTTKHTSRFKGEYLQVIDEEGKPLHKLRPTEKSSSMIPLVEQSQKEIKPTIVCKAVKYKQIYVSACGNVSPCCWLDMEWIPPMQESRIDYMKRIGEFPNLNTSSLEEIFEKGFFNKIEQTWKEVPLQECSKQCGSFDKLGEQFEN